MCIFRKRIVRLILIEYWLKFLLMINLPAIVKDSYFNDGKVVVFIERLEKIITDDKVFSYTIVFDFLIDPLSKNNFIARTNLNFNDNSMLEVSNVTFRKFGVPREGSFYILPEEFINETEWFTVDEDEEFGANYLAFKASYKAQPAYFENAEGYLNFVASIDFGNEHLFRNVAIPFFNSINTQNINISVYNVGQGNWNEIDFNNEALIVYDFGSSSTQVLNDLIRTIVHPHIQRMRIDTVLGYGTLKKVLIISHWDTDHYIGLKTLTDIQLQSFDFCLVPNRIENETTRNVLNRLIENTKVIPMEMNSRIPGGSSSRLTIEFDSTCLKLYKGTKCRDRNKRGLLLSLHHDNKDYVFPGDHHYNQVDSYIMPFCLKDEFNIVIPHHGGNAGNYRLLNNLHHGVNAIVSTGNRYGHPIDEIMTTIGNNFSNIHRTDLNGDFKEPQY